MSWRTSSSLVRSERTATAYQRTRCRWLSCT